MSKSKKIGRILFWFYDNGENLYPYTERFFPLALLLNRLINENYNGKKIQFLNIYYNSPSQYEKFKEMQRDYTHSYGGHVWHSGSRVSIAPSAGVALPLLN